MSLAIAGPWYALNTVKAVKFAIFSSRYDKVAGDRSDRVSTAEHAAAIVGDLAGWPLAATFVSSTFVGSVLAFRKRKSSADRETEQPEIQAHLGRMAWLGFGTSAVVLLYPSYFDPRFLLPIWPVLAIDIGRRFQLMMASFNATPRLLASGGLIASLLLA